MLGLLRRDGMILRDRLQMYLFLLIVALFGCTLLFLSLSGVFSSAEREAQAMLCSHLAAYEKKIVTHYGKVAAQGIRLSGILTRQIEASLAREGVAFSDVSDNPGLIGLLQRDTFPHLLNALEKTSCSGAFLVLDATVNTSLPTASDSRCGLYLKLANINIPSPVNPDVSLLRGMPCIAYDNELEFHNKWELEFSVARMPFYAGLLRRAETDLTHCFVYADTQRLHGTWETFMPLAVPLVGRGGAVYGICGFEISALYYKLFHAESHTPFKRQIGLLARREKNLLFPASGLESGTHAGYFADLGDRPYQVEEGPLYNVYTSGKNVFVGVETPVEISPLPTLDADSRRVVAVLIPKEDMDAISTRTNRRIIMFCIVFFAIAMPLSVFLSQKYVTPILAGIGAVKQGASKTNIPEIDDLIEFLDEQGQRSKEPSDKVEALIHADMSAYYAFIRNIGTLSRAENVVFDLYMRGHSAKEITEILNLSMNTIKTHNKRIYMKLNVTSRKELMVYAQMMRQAQPDQG